MDTVYMGPYGLGLCTVCTIHCCCKPSFLLVDFWLKWFFSC